jgi:hypothetical protein
MRVTFALLAAAAVAAAAPAPLAAQKQSQTLTFETVATNAGGSNSAPFTALGGYSFENWGVFTTAAPLGAGNNASSGAKFAYGFATFPQFIYRADPQLFDLTSAFLSFRTYDGNVSPGTITVRGYRGDAEVFSRVLTLTNSAQLFTFNWADVSEVAFESEALNAGRSAVLAVDDLTLATVPEPATVALVGVGAAVLLAGARRRRGA